MIKKYVYPKFSKYELIGFRFAGPGLGNLLFIYCRALVYSIENQIPLIWPTWFSLRLGPWLRRELDKRTYGDLFTNNQNHVKGFLKYKLLGSISKCHHSNIDNKRQNIILFDYSDMVMSFDDLKKYHQCIYEDLYSNLQEKNKSFEQDDFTNAINVHVRLGDFSPPSDSELQKGYNSISISINWYVQIINELNTILDEKVVFNIFSDGTDEELKNLLAIKNVKRVFYGNSISDIFALSQSKLVIASGSSFSLWARFLGQTDCITYTRQLKTQVLIDESTGFEIEVGKNEKIPSGIVEQIRSKYKV